MEQRIGQNMPPVNVAASDPARIPGLVTTEPGEAKEPEESEAAAVPAADPVDADAEVSADADEGTDTDTEADAETDTDAVQAEAPGAAEEDEDVEEARSPAAEAEADDVTFEATDRRGGVEAGPKGVHFTLDDQETSFTWQEIGAVEHKVSLTGRWFHLIVSTVGQGRYEVDVFTNRKRAKEWQGELEAVLDAYFEA